MITFQKKKKEKKTKDENIDEIQLLIALLTRSVNVRDHCLWNH